MDRYCFDAQRQAWLEASRIPLAVYQFIDQRVVTLALSEGFRKLFQFDDLASAYWEMDNDMYRFTHPEDVARIADAAYSFAVEDSGYDVLYRTRNRDGEDYYVIHAKGEHIYENGVRLAVVWYTDEGPCSEASGSRVFCASRPGKAESEHVSLSYYDFLTGLPNMSYFYQLADAGIRRLRADGRQPAVLFFDLCGMKGFNNRHGFAEGDRMIVQVAKILVNHFSNENCGRFAQDHYAVYTDAEGIEDTLNAIFGECRAVNSLPVRVGIYAVKPEDSEIGRVCDRARTACDVNRKAHVSCFTHFSAAMLENAEKEQYVIDNLDRAIAEGWIRVYYQPIIRAANGRVCDEEALARWIDPEKGMLSPGDFIPVLEEARLIYKVDLCVLEQVLEKMKRQAEAKLYVVPQSVNLSRTDFDACDIVEEVRRRVDASGIGREKLSIEITESTVGRDFNFMKREIERFQKLGFQVWMDDFGSGYSSLDVLQSLHFDLIKLDMHFMQQLDRTEKSRIIVTELVKMAIGLGIETVAEGVEHQKQADFLREIGCTKLQGFYYCKPIPMEEIVERNRRGIQIGFENPEESEYYASIGRVNLYDLAIFSGDDAEVLHRYFDTLPMAIMESSHEATTLVRCNRSYRDFMNRTFGGVDVGVSVRLSDYKDSVGEPFMKAMRQCGEDSRKVFIDEALPDGSTIHAIVRRIAVNPVTGLTAAAVVVLGIIDAPASGITYTHIAQALSADYVNLYYVDLDTGHFIEYSPDSLHRNLAVERHGEAFFDASRRDALKYIDPADRERFIDAFTRENVVQALNDHDTFTLSYRLLVNGAPTYVNMKAVRMGGNHIIIGVNNVDAQMKQQEALARLKAEQTTYARINALSGDYICIYTVDPETDHYEEYSATRDYEGLGLAKAGDDFFGQSRRESARTIYPGDLEMFTAEFRKEKVLDEIQKNGLYVLNYRLMIEGVPHYTCLKAALMQEKDGPRLIVGVNNIDAQVRRDQEYAHNLAVARSLANIDALTGVKNKHAYVDLEAHLDRLIDAKRPLRFAVAVFDINGLKAVNDTQGHQAGDKFLKRGCSIICDIFKRSPVFRVGGDEFAVIARGSDLENLDSLVAKLETLNLRAAEAGGIVISCGTAVYRGEKSVSDVFDRADKNMYQDKRRWKNVE